jgi:kynurenine formamidase
MRYSFLSHEYSERIPVFGGEIDFTVDQLKSTFAGDSTNSFSAEVQSHWGTHIDAPRHFFSDGSRISDFSADNLVFNAPQVIPVTIKPSEILTAASLNEPISEVCDLLLLKSRWTKFRSDSCYCNDNPGVSPEFARMLRADFPKIRAVGIDWISFSAFNHRETGRETHRIFLDPNGTNRAKLLIEDMDLSSNTTSLRRVIVAPLRISLFDSAPCTIFGEWDD